MGVFHGFDHKFREIVPVVTPLEEWAQIGELWVYRIENGRYQVRACMGGWEWAWCPDGSVHRWGGVLLRFSEPEAVESCKLACEGHREGQVKARKLE